MRIDHLVWYCPDLAEGRRHFETRMDQPPAYGGEHPGEGTANCVLGLGPSTYLEILGRDPAQGADSLDPEICPLTGGGLYHWAAGGIDLHVLAERARKAGLDGGALVPGGRKKPDGSWLGWTCFGIRNHGFGAQVPFFIDWMESEHPALAAPQGGSLANFEVFSPQPETLRDIFTALGLDIMVSARAEAGFAATLESRGGRHVLTSFAPVPRGYVI